MEEIVKHINDTNASYRSLNAGDAKNTDLFLDNEHYELFKEAGDQITVRFSKENLSQALLFIASILPRKYDNSVTHKSVSYSQEFVYDQLAFLDYYFKEDGVSVEYKTQKWNARKDVPKKNGEIDNRFYFNGLIEDVGYVNSKGEHVSSKFTIRNYLAGGYSDLHIKKTEDGIFDVRVSNVQEPYFDGKEEVSEEFYSSTPKKFPLQQITYGAPGTGKSHAIKKETAGKSVIRTTFHPDSDYSTFVGAYKPVMEEADVRVVPVVLNNGASFDQNNGTLKEKRISYKFVKQAFLKAYLGAWKKYAEAEEGVEPQFLVIEEINRGNCAQIFGDLFQLLDRNDENGFSTYPIDADTDLQKEIERAFKEEKDGESENPYKLSNDINVEGVVEGYSSNYDALLSKDIQEGRVLLLPPNLYIWATMNTSDQSLFPIDSAFKRRWAWDYVKITDGKKGWMIQGADYSCDWWTFIQKINEKIVLATSSDDKKLGYYFCKAKNNTTCIDEKLFVSKVIFYLWNDVFKDNDNTIFKVIESSHAPSFDDFYMEKDGEMVPNPSAVKQFLINVVGEENVLDIQQNGDVNPSNQPTE